MNNPFKRFVTTQEEEAKKIRQSERVVSQAMQDLLEESAPAIANGEGEK